MQRSLEAYITGRDAGRLQLVAARSDLASRAKPKTEILEALRPAYGVIVAVTAGGVLWLAIVAAVYGLVLT